MAQFFSLANQVAVITGGTSGIGLKKIAQPVCDHNLPENSNCCDEHVLSIRVRDSTC